MWALGALTIGTGNSSDSVRVDAGAVVVTNEVLVGHTSNTRWEILQVNGGSFTSLDTVNGIVLSQNNGTTANNSELYLSGGTTTAEKIAFGVTSDTVGGTRLPDRHRRRFVSWAAAASRNQTPPGYVSHDFPA